MGCSLPPPQLVFLASFSGCLHTLYVTLVSWEHPTHPQQDVLQLVCLWSLQLPAVVRNRMENRIPVPWQVANNLHLSVRNSSQEEKKLVVKHGKTVKPTNLKKKTTKNMSLLRHSLCKTAVWSRLKTPTVTSKVSIRRTWSSFWNHRNWIRHLWPCLLPFPAWPGRKSWEGWLPNKPRNSGYWQI